jgi:prolyl oligopeptidase
VTALGRGREAAPPPETRRGDVVEERFGAAIADPYRWLEDAAAPPVRAWMEAQDAHARAHLGALPARPALAARFRELFYFDAVSAPVRRGDRLFYTRRHADREKAIVYWREAGEGTAERVLFDPNTMSEDGSVSLGVWVPSHDGRRVAYALRQNAADAATLYVRDIDGGGDSPRDVIEGAKYAHPSWTPDGAGFYYTRLPVDPAIAIADLPGHAEVRFHRLGDDPGGDALVYPATGSAETFLDGSLSRDGRFLIVTIAHGWRATDMRVRDLARGDGAPLEPLAVGRDALFHAFGWDGRLYVLTNEGAPRFRLFRVDPARLARDAWQEIIAETDVPIESARIVGGRLALTYLRDAASELVIRTLDGEPVRRVELPGVGTSEGLIGDEDRDDAYFSYSSFTEPPRIYRTSVASGATELWASVSFPVDTSRFAVDQVWYPSRDGTRISMFLIRRRDLQRDGANPTILYGYGGFSVNLTPAFAPGITAWLDRGGLYAIPNLRGGGEYGEAWHEAGMLLAKQNVFDDFIAAAEYLIGERYTSVDRLAIRGGSNGGLLVGAAMTQRPELFRAVVCAVPLLDMLRYHEFGSGRTWVPEYGSPDEPETFAALRAYSPYHRVELGVPYPALLMLSADGDDRVDPMHARKFTAAIQWATTSGRPALLRIERAAGHAGADRTAQEVEQAADTYAFLVEQLGMADEPVQP